METRRNRHADYRTPPEDMVMSAMRSLEAFPVAARAPTLRRLAEFYREAFTAEKLECPDWVGMLATLAEQQERAGGSAGSGREH